MKVFGLTVLMMLAYSLTGVAQQVSNPDVQDSDVVARIGAAAVTRADLERREADKLLQARYQYYLAERKALDDLINNELIEMKAREEQLTVEQLLDREVNSQAKDPTEDQIEVYYEGLDTKEPYADVRQKVLDHIRELRRNKIKTAYLQKLSAAQDVRIALFSPSADVRLESAPALGPRDAPVQVIEFADYECPYCQKVNPELRRLENDLSGKVLIAFKDFPLSMHTRAQKAAEAARCAGEQGKYWEYHDLLFQDRKLDVKQLKEQARALKLEGERFDQCLDSGAEAEAVKKDQDEGQRLGLAGTPSFFVNGHFLSGATSYDVLRKAIEDQLANTRIHSEKKIAQK